MSGLRTAQLRSLLAFADRTLQVHDFLQVPSLLEDLSGVVGSDAATLTHLDLRTQREVVVSWPPGRLDRRLLAVYPAVARGHPLRRPVAVTGRTQPAAVRVSDLMSRRQWRATPFQAAVLPDVDDQMSLRLGGAAPVLHAVTLARRRSSFTDTQRDLLTASARHLAAAVSRARRADRKALQISPTPCWVGADEAPGLAPEASLSPAADRLSARERQVLALVADGLTDAQVARRLGLRPATVSKHLSRIYARLSVANRTAAVQAVTADAAGGRS